MELEYISIKTSGGFMYGGDQKLFGSKVRKSGCGMIAACDMVLFLRCEKSLTFTEYTHFIEDVRDNDAYRKTSNPIGVSPFKVAQLINTRTENHRFQFISRIFFGKKALGKFIEKSVAAGLPVIVRIGANGKKLPYSIVYPASGGRSAAGTITWHYVTVTGISDSGMLTFSSWSGKGEMRLEDLHRYFGITGGIITDRKYVKNFAK
ncbi:MAG: hypothetical protein K2H23_00230 [Oscillospiraceae bacterium]|nr:hypothetical protein [Oscillospiraceae bacterium]